MKLYLGYRLARARNWRWRRWARHWTWPKAIVLLLTLGPLSIGLAHWGVSQTFTNLKIDFICGQIVDVEHPAYYSSGQYGKVSIMLGFDNPGIPISLDWTITGQSNVTAGTINGFLSSTIPHGNNVLNMTFYILSWVGNGTINQIFSFTKYQALYNTVADPRIFSQSYDPSSPIHDYRKVNDTAIYFPVFLAYLFYTQTGYYPRVVTSSSQFTPSCKSLLAVYGFSI
jgi:hypothetical protein